MAWLKGGIIGIIIALILMYIPLSGTATGNAIKTSFNHTDFVSFATGNSTNYTMIGSWFIIGAILGLFFGRSGSKPKEEETKPEEKQEDDEPDDEPDEEPEPIAEEKEEVKE
jgi:hypothetical protein